MAGAGLLQLGNNAEASQWIQMAKKWGCSKSLIVRILVSGIHNSLGKAAMLAGNPKRAKKHFKEAIANGSPHTDVHLFTQARISTQRVQTRFSKALSAGTKSETNVSLT